MSRSPRHAEVQQHVQQGDQALAVGVQKAEDARAPETIGQHMLQDQPEEVRAGQRSAFDPLCLGVLIAATAQTRRHSTNAFIGASGSALV